MSLRFLILLRLLRALSMVYGKNKQQQKQNTGVLRSAQNDKICGGAKEKYV
jgi:hypothetical protein